MLGRTLTRVELGDRIEEATRRTAQNYRKGLKEVAEAKTRINDLELTAVDSGSAKNNQLNSALDLLMKLTDSMIFESGRAWDDYEKLEHDCTVDECESSDLDDLRELCRKTEEFATDLLCYSLAHFRKGTRNSL